MCYDDDEGFQSWADEFLPRYPSHAFTLRWAHSGAAVMGGKGWRILYEASRMDADDTPEGRVIQACVEVGAIPYRERYQVRHAAS